MEAESDKIVAVITGDVVDSIKVENRELLLLELRQVFSDLKQNILPDANFEIYRGDSFQGIIIPPNQACKVAILIRSRLLMTTISNAKLDARIAIGIGRVSYSGKTIPESDGEAFHYSGRLLDQLKKDKKHLGLETKWADVNAQLSPFLDAMDFFISRWSVKDAEISYHYLLRQETQTQLAKRFSISQPAVHKRIYHSAILTMEAFIERFELIIKEHTND